MKKTTRSVVKTEDDDLRPHYDFDYSKSRSNRFANLPREQTIVMLDKDLSKVFRTPEEVKHALRSLIEAMPAKSSRATRAA
jgi:hypothetical protein